MGEGVLAGGGVPPEVPEGRPGNRRVNRLDLPPVEIETQAFWFTLPDELLAQAGLDRRNAPGALHAAEHTMIAMMPLFAICDPLRDIGGLSTAHTITTPAGRSSSSTTDTRAGRASPPPPTGWART